jgi:hypothetical protein
MSNVVCVDCGMEAHSKCPFCRTVFPNNQTDAMLSWTCKHRIKEVNNFNWLQVEFMMREDETEEDTFKRLHSLLDEMVTKPKEFLSLKEFCCDHRWVFKPGEKSTIGCGHDGG